jgi:hypothetical protein
VIVVGFIPSLNVAERFVLIATPVVRATGIVELTVGDVVSVVRPVVKLHETSASRATPAIFFAPAVIVAVYSVLAVKLPERENVAVLSTYVTTPATAVEPCLRVKVVAVIVAGSIASLKVAVRLALSATFVAASAGIVKLTVGPVKTVTFLSLSSQPAIKIANVKDVIRILKTLMIHFSLLN